MSSQRRYGSCLTVHVQCAVWCLVCALQKLLKRRLCIAYLIGAFEWTKYPSASQLVSQYLNTTLWLPDRYISLMRKGGSPGLFNVCQTGRVASHLPEWPTEPIPQDLVLFQLQLLSETFPSHLC